jgi:hypothetical protein
VSTRSRIGIQRDNGTVRSIYCHFDGYESGVGATLLEHYTNEKKIRSLIALGDLSYLGPELGEDVGPDRFDKRYQKDAVIPEEWENWTMAYRRDRGEKNVNAITHPADRWPDSWQEYEYLWRNGSWYYRDTYSDTPKEWAPLTAAAAEEPVR